MKKLCAFVVIAFFHVLNVQGQHTGDFRSVTGKKVSWNNSIAWESYNGNVWTRVSKRVFPSKAGVVEIKAGDTIVVNDSLSVFGNLKVNGVFEFGKNKGSHLKVYGNVTIGKNGAITPSLSGSVLNQLLHISGKINTTASKEGITAGIYAVGPSAFYPGYAGSYKKLTDAITAITSVQLNGNIIFEFQPDYDPSIETNAINLSSNIWSGETSTITFRPASTVNTVINFSKIGTVLNNTGADFIIFDGRNGGSGSNHYLQFENIDIYHSTISLSNDALHNKFLYCSFTGSTKATDTGILTLITTNQGNNFNAVDHCNFNGNGSVNNCIFTKGVVSDLTITNSNFFDFRNGAGINIFNKSDNLIIDNNNFYQTTPYPGFAGTTSGIIINGGANCRISNNNIGGNSSGLNGTWNVSDISTANYYFTGINATLLSATSKIYNNRIQNINWKTNLANWTGIYVSGDVKVGTDGANYIGNNTGNDNIVLNYYSDGASKVCGIISEGPSIIENNIIGSFTTLLNGTVGTGVNFTGIYSTGTGIINKNTIGSSVISNSINISPQSNTGYSQNVYGIYSSGSTVVISNNIIANLNNGSTVSSGVTSGIIISNSINPSSVTVNSNTIHTISSSQPVTPSDGTASLHGINLQAINNPNPPIVTITGNSIYDLVNLSSSGICINGILFSSSSGLTNKVDKNYIHSFKSASNTSIQNGINIINGSATFQNNVIRLGIDVNGNSVKSTAQINGIAKSSTGSCHFYFNTVYIGGSNVMDGLVKTYALSYLLKSGQNGNVKNNIFINMRTGIISNKLNYAVLEPATVVNNWSSDYNIYYVTPSDGKLSFINGADVLTLKGLQTAYPGSDLHSGFGDPLLSHPTDAMVSMDLRPLDLSPAESTGLDIAGITDDCSGADRNSNTPTDIGAYSGNMIRNNLTQDIFCPVIQYVKLGNVSSLTNRLTKNFAVITDNVGRININSGTKPRFYYKLSANADAFVGNTASDNGWKWVEANGVTSPFDFNIDYNLLFGGPVKLNSNIQYFVVAQNLSTVPNVTFYPTKGATGVSVSPEGMKAPSDRYNYFIVPSVPTTMNVGNGQRYTTLTGAGGVFDSINSGAINANIHIIIKSDLNEPGTIILKPINEDGPNAGALALAIQSDGVSHIISGSNINTGAPLISLSGIKRLVIDGGVNKSLTFRNTNSNPANTEPVFQFDNSCQNDTLINCTIESNLISTSSGAIVIGSVGLNSVTISQNDIRDSRGGTSGSPLTGIYSSLGVNTLNIINNNIYNLKNSNSYGMYLNQVANGCTIKGNSFYMETGFSSLGSFTGIWVGYSNNHFISENYVGGSAPKCGGNNPFTITGPSTFTGINTYCTGLPEVVLDGNIIQNIKMTNTTTPVFYGINNNAGPVTMTSNTIGSKSDLNSVQIAGTGNSAGIIESYAGVVYSSTIEKNTIANITLTNSTGTPGFSALNTTGGTVRMNSIYNIGSPNQTLTPFIYGIRTSIGIATNEFSNNAISLNGGEATTSKIYGFYDDSSSGSTGFYYNSINITGSALKDTSTYAYYSTSNTPCVLKNNILVNTRTGGTGKHYALYSALISGLTSDFNDLYVAGPTLGHFGADGTAIDLSNLGSWKSFTNQDANSISNDPLFNSLNSLIPDISSLVNGSGIPVGSVNTDIRGTNRNAIVTTLGAYELECNGVKDGGIIKSDQLIDVTALPELITCGTPASGFYGKIEYKWQNSVSPFSIWIDLPTSNTSVYQPGLLTETTLFKRLARTTCMTNWSEAAESNIVTLTLNLNKWNGNFDNNWNNPLNWSLSKIPDDDGNILFADHPLHDCFLDKDRSVHDISNHQSYFKLNINGKTLTVKGVLNFTNGALLNSDIFNSTLVFSGTTFQTIPSNIFENNRVYNLTIDNAAGVSPESDFVISHLLTINAGKQLIIPANRLLDVYGTIKNYAGTSGLILKTSSTGELPNGSLIFHNDITSPVPATVEMNSIANWTTDQQTGARSNYKWEFFGIPVQSLNVNPIFDGAFVRQYNEAGKGSGYDASNRWIQLVNGCMLTPFTGYEIVQSEAKTYSFTGNLVNNDLVASQLNFTTHADNPGQYLFSNPYTAAINISQLNLGKSTDGSVYLYNTGSLRDWSTNNSNKTSIGNNPGQYISAPVNNAGGIIGIPSQIPSMQGFLVMATDGTAEAKFGIPYSAVTKNTVSQRTIGLNKTQSSNPKVYTIIDVKGKTFADRMWLISDPTCSHAFDNGWDGSKIFGSVLAPQIYAMERDGIYQVNTVDDINDTYLGFKPGIDTTYTLSFNHQNMDLRYEKIYLLDKTENKTVDITSTGSEYTFTTSSKAPVDNRFKIIATHEIIDIPTETKSVETITQPISVFNSGNIIVIKNQTGSNGLLYLFDCTGRLIEKSTFVANGITTLTTQLPTGLYLVNAVTAENRKSALLMIREFK